MDIPKESLKDWIVEDLTSLFSIFDENRYNIFKDENDELLRHIRDNLNSLGLKESL